MSYSRPLARGNPIAGEYAAAGESETLFRERARAICATTDRDFGWQWIDMLEAPSLVGFPADVGGGGVGAARILSPGGIWEYDTGGAANGYSGAMNTDSAWSGAVSSSSRLYICARLKITAQPTAAQTWLYAGGLDASLGAFTFATRHVFGVGALGTGHSASGSDTKFALISHNAVGGANSAVVLASTVALTASGFHWLEGWFDGSQPTATQLGFRVNDETPIFGSGSKMTTLGLLPGWGMRCASAESQKFQIDAIGWGWRRL